MSEKTRAYIYRIVLAVIPLLIGLGFIPEVHSTAIVELAAALLGVGAAGLAVANTSTQPQS